MIAGSVCFYQLGQKIVSSRESVPENARQVVYYSLAIGHHVGVMDCFCVLMKVPLDDYRLWIDRLPEGSARQKMEGVLRWGEIEVNQSHVSELMPVLQAGLPGMNEVEVEWTSKLIGSLEKIVEEPALYLMVRRMN